MLLIVAVTGERATEGLMIVRGLRSLVTCYFSAILWMRGGPSKTTECSKGD